MWLFLLVSSFSELVLFPPYIVAVLDLYYENLSSHLRRLFLSNLLVGFVESHLCTLRGYLCLVGYIL